MTCQQCWHHRLRSGEIQGALRFLKKQNQVIERDPKGECPLLCPFCLFPMEFGFPASVVLLSVAGDGQALQGGWGSPVRPRSSLSIRGPQATAQERVSRCSELSAVDELRFISLAG